MTQQNSEQSNSHHAVVDVLTATVQVLMVGSRQVTLSVYRQLDVCPTDEMEMFGRVRDGRDDLSKGAVAVVGRDAHGALTRGVCARPLVYPVWGNGLVRAVYGYRRRQAEMVVDGRRIGVDWDSDQIERAYTGSDLKTWEFLDDDAKANAIEQARENLADYDLRYEHYAKCCNLPLIVLAGLR
jgi:hypothetical protein